MIDIDTKIYVAGHRGMVGSAIVRILQQKGYQNIITQTHRDLDLTNQSATRDFFERYSPDQVYLAAAKVGGIHANNTYPAEFIFNNLMIESNVIHEAWRVGVKKLLFLGSSCIYPKLCSQPIAEESLLTGILEPTNEPYAIAKIAGIKLCESYNRQYGVDYRCVMPANLYGQGDSYHPENSHVIPALIRKFHQAKQLGSKSVTIWGSGVAKREFLHVNDLAEASVHIMDLERSFIEQYTKPMQSHINVGAGVDVSIAELAQEISDTASFTGKIEFDRSMPDGTPRKVMQSDIIRELGWTPKISLAEGLIMTYRDYVDNFHRYNATGVN